MSNPSHNLNSIAFPHFPSLARVHDGHEECLMEGGVATTVHPTVLLGRVHIPELVDEHTDRLGVFAALHLLGYMVFHPDCYKVQ